MILRSAHKNVSWRDSETVKFWKPEAGTPAWNLVTCLGLAFSAETNWAKHQGRNRNWSIEA